MAPKQPTAGPSRQKMPSTSSAPPPHPSVSSFSPSRTHFATSTPILGSAEKLQIWEVASDRVISEWDVENASKVTSICWTTIPTLSGGSSQGKRKRRKKAGTGALVEGGEEDVVVLSTDKGELVLYSPTSGSVVKREQLKDKITASWASDLAVVLASDKSILVLSPEGAVSHTFALPPNSPPPSAVSVLPTSSTEVLHVLIGSMNVVVLHLSFPSSKVVYTSSPLPVSTSSVTSLHPLPTTSQGSSFLVVSEDDRTVSQYTLPTPTTQPKLSYRYASPTLSPAHSLTLSQSRSQQLLAVLHQSGEISIFPTPSTLDFSRPSSDVKPATVKIVEGKEERLARLAGIEFVDLEDDNPSASSLPGKLICGRMAGGGRIKWSSIGYELPEGGLRSSTVFKVDAQDLIANAASSSTIPLQRFAAPSGSAHVENEDVEDESSALPTDVDMADLSLGEQLLSLPNGGGNAHPLNIENKTATSTTTKSISTSSAAAALAPNGPVNANSLTRLLTQALHTSDPALLTLCLTHRDPVLIRNTIRKMPATMALPLLKACVERLGQGKGASRRGGGRGGGQSEQQGRGTVEWVKGVLVERGSILMTIPSLPLHLATLSRLLETRLQLNAPLLQLSGRLDLALAQITMRRIALEQANAASSRKQKDGGEVVDDDDDDDGEGERYVEGESDEDEEIEVGDGDGEIEDVDMRAGSEGDDDEDDDDNDDVDIDDDDDDEDDDEDEDEDEDDTEEEDEEDPLDSGSDDGFVDVVEDESQEGEVDSEEED